MKGYTRKYSKTILLYLVDRFFNEDAEGAPIAQ